MKTPIIIGIATIDGRQAALKETLKSLAPQADRIVVYVNDYALPEPDYKTVFCNNGSDYGDAGKFFFNWWHNGFYPFMDEPSYCLTCDDDLIYPPDYVERMIEGIERYERKAVCSFHGKAFTEKAYPWYNSTGKRYPCLREVSADNRITIPGTGVMGWHSSLLTITLDDFPAPNMADIWFGKKCNDLGIPRYVLAHEEGWIRHTDKIDMDSTLWRVNKADAAKTEYITEVFNSVEWKL